MPRLNSIRAFFSAALGSRSLRIFPNDFHKDVPREKTIAQIEDREAGLEQLQQKMNYLQNHRPADPKATERTEAALAQLQQQLVALDAKDHAAVVAFCEEHAIGLVVIGPEAPLVDGL